MSDLDLGALRAQLAIDMDGLDASVKRAVGGLDKIEKAAETTSKKTEELGKTLKNGLKGEVLANSLQRAANGIRELDGQFSGLTRSIEGAGVVLQGLFAGNLAGGLIAAIGFGVSTIASEWGKAQAATEKAAEAIRDNYKKAVDEVVASITKLDERIAVARKAAADKTDLTTAGGALSAAGAERALVEAAASRDPVVAELEQLRAELSERREERSLMPLGGTVEANAVGAEMIRLERSIKEQEAALKPLTDAYELAKKKFEEASKTIVATKLEAGVAKSAPDPAKATVPKLHTSIEELIRVEKDVAKAAKLALKLNDKDPAKLHAFEEKQRADAWAKSLARMTDPDSSIAEEKRSRAARDKEYASRAGETLFVDDPEESKRKAAEKERLKRQSDHATAIAQYSADADAVTADIMGGMFFFEDVVKGLGVGIYNASQSLQSGLKAIETGFNAGGFWGAVSSFGVTMITQSKQFQWVTNMVDSGMQRIADAFGSLIGPLVPLADVLISVVGGFAELIIGPIAAAFEAVAPILYEVAKGIAWAYNGVNSAIADLIDGIVLVTGGDLSPFKFLGDWADEMREKTIKLPPTYDAYIKSMEDADKAAQKVAASFLNLPAGFKTAAAIYGATSASSAPFGGYAPPAAPGLPPLAAAAGGGSSGGGGSGDTFNFYAPIYVSGDEGFTNVVTVSAHQSSMATSGTTGGRQSNRQSPTPHAPNATQPYTPASP